jgi:hypothetical protein
MDRSSWSAISKDPDIWKKIGVGAGSLAFILTSPIALGIVNSDLEAEVQRRQDKEPAGAETALPPVDDLLKLLTSGIGPAMLFVGALMMFAIATIPVGLSYFQLYALFRPANELVPELHQKLSIPITSVLLYFIIGGLGLAAQAMVAASLPVALAQYARGKDLRPALAVVPNALTVMEMGMPYWLKAAGTALGMMAMTIIFITGGFGFGFLASTLAWVFVAAALFISLVLASRFALEHVAAEIAPLNLPPLPDEA